MGIGRASWRSNEVGHEKNDLAIEDAEAWYREGQMKCHAAISARADIAAILTPRIC
jgi:hypothetical protein